ncbi:MULTISPECIES: hypothetical protein [unclassified Microcoleus]|uniref:hypothetical protein n=1 Tax=unclassified Microcoleus TaxID=2642155 RepID=UPI002FD14682
MNANVAHAAIVSVQSTIAGSTPVEQRVCSHARCVSSNQLASTVESPAANTVSLSRTSERICGAEGCLAPAKVQALRASYKKAQAANTTRPQMIARADGVIEYPMTDQESNAAIALFGCDCPTCVNALRQLMGQAPYM